ncbi:MAG: LysM peptidoglycan-binding domain-containing protein [Mycobacteriales bacterium]
MTNPRVTPPGTGRAPVRLTRRGRVLVVLVAAALLFAAFSIGRVSGRAATPPLPPVRTVVAPGQTLWQIAERLAPSSDPRVTVERIRAINHLSGYGVLAGQQLLLPASQ